MWWGESMNLSSVKCVALYHTSEPCQRQHTTRFKDFFTFHFMGKCIHVRWMFFLSLSKISCNAIVKCFWFQLCWTQCVRKVRTCCVTNESNCEMHWFQVGFRFDSTLKTNGSLFCTCRKRETATLKTNISLFLHLQKKRDVCYNKSFRGKGLNMQKPSGWFLDLIRVKKWPYRKLLPIFW